MAVGDKVYIADKPTLDTVKTNTDDIKTKIGDTNDAQSSSTSTGSVFAKLNYLVSQISAYLSTTYSWTNTLLSRIGN